MKNIITSSDRAEFMSAISEIFAFNGMTEYLADGKDEAFFRLACLLTEFNSHTNLTAITDIRGVILRHFVDSLTAVPYLQVGASVADVGTGGGFPALPLAIVRPDLTITGIDSTAKKLRFSDLAASELGLTNLKTLCGRAEELSCNKGLRESFDTVIARAVAPLQILSELCIPLLRVGGDFIALKGNLAEEELSQSESAIEKLGADTVSILPCDLTEDGQIFESRFVIRAEKVRKTPPAYPRLYSKIKSNPL